MLHYHTVNDLLQNTLTTLMHAAVFNPFRLVGGTALSLHLQRYPYSHDRNLILTNLTNFEEADNDFDPICFKGKYWEFIKADFEDLNASK